MANAIYPKYKHNLMTANTGADVNLSANSGNDIKVFLCNSTYTYAATHDYHNDLSGIIDIGVPVSGAIVYANGTVNFGDVTYTAVPAQTAAQSIVIVKWNGGTANSHLIAYLDTGVTGLPVTPNGGDITITWDAQGVFTL